MFVIVGFVRTQSLGTRRGAHWREKYEAVEENGKKSVQKS